MRIFAKIRQVYDRLCERKEASADRMRQEREHLSEQADEAPNARARGSHDQAGHAPVVGSRRWERLLADERDRSLSTLPGAWPGS